MKEVTGAWKEKQLTIFLAGHIDSNNSEIVGEEIRKIMEEQGREPEELIIDAGKLDYISSAGLRILLRIRKSVADMRIIQVNADVYEILDMTGFTELMNVEKAYRQVSVDGCEVIGTGANGTLYRIDKDNVVKVYKNKDALEDIQNERAMARTALVLGIPTAISYDVVKVGDHYGSVFELLNARSFAEILKQEPEKFDWCVREFTAMLKKIHSTVVPQGKLPDKKETLLKWVEYLQDYLPQEKYRKLLKMVREVPRDNHMIHGDYHLKNLELQGDEVLLIDMDTLGVGHPIIELGSMFNAFVGFSEFRPEEIKRFLGIDREIAVRFWHETLAQYLSTDSQEAIREVEDKARIIGYSRLIRRAIRRGALEDPERKREVELWTGQLLALLDRVDTLLFFPNEIQVDAREERLDEITNYIHQRLESTNCSAHVQFQIDMAVEEIFVNIAKYAYRKNHGTAWIKVEVYDPERRVTIQFRDRGTPFDPFQREDPDTTLSVQEREIGGLGIFLVKNTMDKCWYEYKDGQNVLTIEKRY